MSSSNSGWRTPMMEQRDKERARFAREQRRERAKSFVKRHKPPANAVGAVFNDLNNDIEWTTDIPWFDGGSFDVTVDGKNQTYDQRFYTFIQLIDLV